MAASSSISQSAASSASQSAAAASSLAQSASSFSFEKKVKKETKEVKEAAKTGYSSSSSEETRAHPDQYNGELFLDQVRAQDFFGGGGMTNTVTVGVSEYLGCKYISHFCLPSPIFL